MALAVTLRGEKGKRLDSILAFAIEVQSQLPTAIAAKRTDGLSQSLKNSIATFPERLEIKEWQRYNEVDAIGTGIWNTCIRLRREYDADKPQNIPLVLLLARVFAFLLLDSAHSSGKSDKGNLTRLLKTGNKAAKGCLERRQYDLAHIVLEKVGGYGDHANRAGTGLGEDAREANERLVAEYYVLRTALAWHQDQLHVAEHMFTKAMSSLEYFEPTTSESLSDVFYEMGKDLFGKKDYQLAIKWLDRAYEILNGPQLDKLSIDAAELRISIIQTSIRSLLASQKPETVERARSLVDLLENEVGASKLIVMLLRLELLNAPTNESFDSNAYADILGRMIRNIALNNSNFRLIMYHIRKLNDKSPSLACVVLDEFLNLRILRAELDELSENWVEKILITRLWITTMQKESPETFSSLDMVLSSIADNTTKPVSSAATLGAHALLWKRIESNYTQRQYDIAEKWCYVAIHRIFEKPGEINMARISRKLLLCALGRNDARSGREIFSSMSESAKNEPMSRFLMYKIATRCGETELAAECLQIISASSARDPKLLYACVLDAQHRGNKAQTLAALALVIEHTELDASTGVHLPSLLRTTIGLMIRVLDEASGGSEATVEKICTIFEKAILFLRKSRGPATTIDQVWTVDELDWFSRHSYNLAIKYLSDWRPQHSLRMLSCCINFIDQYPSDIDGQVSDDIVLRKLFCEFSASTILVSLARGEDNIEAQLQNYLILRKHIDGFDVLLQKNIEGMNADVQADLQRKLAILVSFDFEAACRLKSWDTLGEVILKAEICKNCQVYEVMADIILSSEAPTFILVTTLKKIINEMWGIEVINVAILAKYMRCLFQITISGNAEIAEQLLDQVQSHAEAISESEQTYPSEELEWITTRAFNYAVDLFCTGDDEASKKWAHKALNIAVYCGDGGSLEKLLQSKLLELKFGS